MLVNSLPILKFCVFQVMLFFYMVVLFLIFLIQFSVSCAALAIDDEDEIAIVKKVR